jgi:hypothetical protein
MEIVLNLTIVKQEEYDNLISYLNQTTIKVKQLSYNVGPTTILNPEEITSFIFIPNNEFKIFVGSENMNQYGYISLRSAYELIINYAKNNSLYFDSYIELNNHLSDALKLDKKSILISELYNHLLHIFRRV